MNATTKELFKDLNALVFAYGEVTKITQTTDSSPAVIAVRTSIAQAITKTKGALAVFGYDDL